MGFPNHMTFHFLPIWKPWLPIIMAAGKENGLHRRRFISREKQIIYRPFLLIAITFSITWICAVFLAYQTWFRYDAGSGKLVLWTADFMKSASPTIAALILWRRPLFRERGIFRFLLGKRPELRAYAVVIFLFALQFLTFFIFRQPGSAISLPSFFTIWAGQIIFGGGMEEGGWRGYL